MPLAEYLTSEQAREDVKALLAKPCPQVMPGDPVGWRHYGIQALPHPAPPSPWMGVAADYGGRAIALPDWRTVSAYYLPYGDRYVVTDLGEGVRALRLRTGWIHGRANGHAMQERETLASGGVGWVAGMSGDIELDGVKEDQLPDAVCRVMLASLRVAGVSNV